MATREDFCSFEALEAHCAPLSALSGVTTGDVAEAISSATDLIWALTGRQFGAYTETVRPDLRNVSSSSFDLRRFPVNGITEVKIDGVVLDPSEYWVSDGHVLNRTDGTSWPVTQKLYLDDTEEETFSVTLTWGGEPPIGVQQATRRLACELLSLKFGGQSGLPDRVRSTVRQGISMEHVSAEDLLNNGRTGIFEIDLVLSTYNRDETAALPAVMSPDIGWYDHDGTTTVGAAPSAVGGVSEAFVLAAISAAVSGASGTSASFEVVYAIIRETDIALIGGTGYDSGVSMTLGSTLPAGYRILVVEDTSVAAVFTYVSDGTDTLLAEVPQIMAAAVPVADNDLVLPVLVVADYINGTTTNGPSGSPPNSAWYELYDDGSGNPVAHWLGSAGGGGDVLFIDAAIYDPGGDIDLGAVATFDATNVLVAARPTGSENGLYDMSTVDGWTLVDPQPTAVFAKEYLTWPGFTSIEADAAWVMFQADPSGWVQRGFVPTALGGGGVTGDSELVATSTTLTGPPHTIAVAAAGSIDITVTLPDATDGDKGLVWYIRNLNSDSVVYVANLAEGDETITESKGLLVSGIETDTPGTYAWMKVGFVSETGTSGGGGGGVTDHGLLTGLSDDDHTQYAKKASNLSDLASAATARTNLGLGTAAVAATGDFDAAGTAAGLVDDLSGVSNQATARTNLGLGTAATAATGDFAATSHTHTGTQVTVDASGFNGNLTTSDDTVQEIAQKLDDLTVSGGTGGFTRSLMLGGM